MSHDRGFVRRAASKILEIRDGRAEFYPGTYDEYVWSVQKGALSLRDLSSSSADAVKAELQEHSGHRQDEVSEKFNFKERKKALEKELRFCEKESARLDQEMNRAREAMIVLNEKLSVVAGVQAGEIAREIARLQTQIDDQENVFLSLLERQELLEKELKDRF